MNKYWVQTIYAVIAPNGTAEDYFYTKKEAVKSAKKCNEESKESPNA